MNLSGCLFGDQRTSAIAVVSRIVMYTSIRGIDSVLSSVSGVYNTAAKFDQ